MKVSELIGTQLDYWVMRAEGGKMRRDGVVSFPDEPMPYGIIGNASVIKMYPEAKIYSPSSNWAIGGPIIGRERIDLEWEDRSCQAMICSVDLFTFEGSDPLVVAMRCYVASKFGDEVLDD